MALIRNEYYYSIKAGYQEVYFTMGEDGNIEQVSLTPLYLSSNDKPARYGTAFFVDSIGVLVTNRDVVSAPKIDPQKYTLYKNQIMDALVMQKEEKKRDKAVLQERIDANVTYEWNYLWQYYERRESYENTELRSKQQRLSSSIDRIDNCLYEFRNSTYGIQFIEHNWLRAAFNGSRLTGKESYVSCDTIRNNNDLSLIYTIDTEDSVNVPESVYVFSLAAENVTPSPSPEKQQTLEHNQELYLLGFEGDPKSQIVTAQLDTVKVSKMLNNAYVQYGETKEGFNGCPVINSDGELIAVNCCDANGSYGILLKSIRAILSDIENVRAEVVKRRKSLKDYMEFDYEITHPNSQDPAVPRQSDDVLQLQEDLDTIDSIFGEL